MFNRTEFPETGHAVAARIVSSLWMAPRGIHRHNPSLGHNLLLCDYRKCQPLYSHCIVVVFIHFSTFWIQNTPLIDIEQMSIHLKHMFKVVKKTTFCEIPPSWPIYYWIIHSYSDFQLPCAFSNLPCGTSLFWLLGTTCPIMRSSHIKTSLFLLL